MPLSRFAEITRVRAMILAPRLAASRALSTTRRASLTQPSEYSNALVNSRFNGLPAGSRVMSSVAVAGSSLRPPIWS
ncbi:hypothetical protein D3C87_1935900 [compost metagenome]